MDNDPLSLTTLLLGVSALTAVLGLALALPLLLKARRSAGWPRVPATVLEAQVLQRGANATAPRIRYAYPVNGRRHTGERVAVGGSWSTTGHGAARLVAQHPAGATVQVAVDPQQPAYALLKPGLQPQHLLLATPLLTALVLAVATAVL